MASIADFLRRLFSGGSRSTEHRRRAAPSAGQRRSQTAPPQSNHLRAQDATQQPTKRGAGAQPGPPHSDATVRGPTRPSGLDRLGDAEADVTVVSSSATDADDYLDRLQQKINKLAEEFAAGAINRDQFQQLFDHYQRERQAILNWKEASAGSDDWKDVASEGKSIVIRSRHTSKVLGYAIYENESGMPLNTIGQFEIDPELAVPMLSSYRSATKEIFGGEMRSTQIEGGKWLCFVPGETTTMLALFSNEPAPKQLATMEDLHRLFETANRRQLGRSPVNPEELAFPHSSFLGRFR